MTVVHRSRRRTALLAGLSLLLVLAGTWLTGLLGDGFTAVPLPSVVGVVVGALAIACFGAAFAVLVRDLVRHPPALVLTPAGFTDRGSLSGVGEVAWSEVSAVGARGRGSTRCLVMDLHFPDAVVDRLGGIRARMVRASLRSTGHPVNIPLAGLDLSESELLARIDELGHLRRLGG